MNRWHELQLHVSTNGQNAMIELWWDGELLYRQSEAMAVPPVGGIKLGDDSTSHTFDIAFDDFAIDRRVSAPAPITCASRLLRRQHPMRNNSQRRRRFQLMCHSKPLNRQRLSHVDPEPTTGASNQYAGTDRDPARANNRRWFRNVKKLDVIAGEGWIVREYGPTEIRSSAQDLLSHLRSRRAACHSRTLVSRGASKEAWIDSSLRRTELP